MWVPILPRRFYIRFRPFVRILTVARIRKKYDCFAVYIFLKAYVNKDNLHEFQSKIFLSRSTQMSNGSLWWNSNTFKRVETIKTCVAVSIFSRKITGLLRSLSVGTLICRASLIKHLLIISSFTSLYNSGRRGKLRLCKRNSERHSSSSNHRS